MRKEEEILRAFLVEKLSEAGLTPDEGVLELMARAVTLEEGNPDEESETRHITIQEDTDKKTTAKSIKLYNLMTVSFYDLTGFLLKEMSILLSKDTRVMVFLSLLNLLHEFYPKLAYRFNETDAKILSAIYHLNKGRFSASELSNAYSLQFGESLTAGQMERSLIFFDRLKVLKSLSDGNYAVKERMTFERK